ncbi:MAG TPA: thioredoxin fold domain-containing protein [Thermoanaerobaculia bacterium]
MKRIALVAALAVVLVPHAYGAAWIKTVGAAEKQAKAKNQYIFVDLFADWCGWCHRFEQEVTPSEAFQKATDDMVLLRLDTEDGKEGTQFARKFNVTSLPTFLVLAPDMTLAGVIRGYAPAGQFGPMVTDTRKKYEEFLARVKDEAKLGTNYEKRLELAKEFTTRQAPSKAQVRLEKLAAEKALPANLRDQVMYELAVTYVLQKKYAEGQKTIQKLTSVSKSGEPVERSKILLGQIYMEQGNLQGAANELRSFKTTYPNSPLIANVNAILPQIERQLAVPKSN